MYTLQQTEISRHVQGHKQLKPMPVKVLLLTGSGLDSIQCTVGCSSEGVVSKVQAETRAAFGGGPESPAGEVVPMGEIMSRFCQIRASHLTGTYLGVRSGSHGCCDTL